ncbi:unnamed protein product [Bursaphelenchus okinawaensis]|uniref:SANTA domain-containing protein n=1 Tax=Bursaphelenchus okinawaensis TaxID=465554 RepID=A0A811L0P4_9BILA|nr:unnamed protein product [Bursaphelenchus okinawaensis]CAG9114051.1 unnamed protein product [Bursaphelenchus okinawaensis]
MDDTLNFLSNVQPPKRRSGGRKAAETSSKIPKLVNVPKRNVVVLVGWRLQFRWVVQGAIFPNFALLVEGLRTDTGAQWTSSEISKVVPPCQLYTQNTIYEIRGSIDKEKLVQRGFDVEFINKFKLGFPVNWKEEITIYVKALLSAVADVKKSRQEEAFAPNDADVTVEDEDNIETDKNSEMTKETIDTDMTDFVEIHKRTDIDNNVSTQRGSSSTRSQVKSSARNGNRSDARYEGRFSTKNVDVDRTLDFDNNSEVSVDVEQNGVRTRGENVIADNNLDTSDNEDDTLRELDESDVKDDDEAKSDDSFEVAIPSDWSEGEDEAEEQEDKSDISEISEISVGRQGLPSQPESALLSRRQSQYSRRMSKAPDMAVIEEENSNDLGETRSSKNTTRRTSKNNTRRSSQANMTDSFDLPDLQRSKRGRLLKPRLGAGERIVYDKDGDIVEIRQNTTRTHLNPTASQSIFAIAKSLGMEAPDSPSQKERRLSNITQKSQKRRRSSTAGKRKPLVEYDSEDDYKSLDEMSLDEPQAEPTPLPCRKPARRRLMSDSEDEEVEEEQKENRKSKRVKTIQKPKKQSPKKTAKKTTPKNKKSVKSKSKPTSAATRSSARKKKSAELDESSQAGTSKEQLESEPTTPVATPKKRKATWNLDYKERLKGLVKMFNPSTVRDWEIISENFEGAFTADECKEQAAKMKIQKKNKDDLNESQIDLNPVMNVFAELNNANLKERGTLRYQKKENEATNMFFKQVQKIRKAEEKKDLNCSQDSMDEIMADIARDYRPPVTAPTAKFTPNRRQYVPIPVAYDRRKSSIAPIDDSFDLPDWSNRVKTKFRLRN